jgi:hypothetical protein
MEGRHAVMIELRHYAGRPLPTDYSESFCSRFFLTHFRFF